MGSANQRRRKRASSKRSLETRVERAGHVALTSLWSAMVRVVGAAIRWVARMGVGGWRGFASASRSIQFVLGAAVVGLAVAAALLITRDGAVYVDDESEALARVIHSECGGCSRQKQLHIAWATRNLAAERNQTVAEMACSPCGKQERGRPVSTRQEANNRDRTLARYVVGAPPIADPTGGATHFINPELQDALAAAGDRPGYRGNSYRVVRARWIKKYGWSPYYRLGPDLEMWGPKRRRK